MVALRKVVNGEDASVIPPMTIARAFPREQICVLTDDEGATRVTASVRFIDSAQFAIQMSGERRAHEGIELFHRDPPAKVLRWFAFTEKKLFVLDTEPKIVRTMRSTESFIHVVWPSRRKERKTPDVKPESAAADT
jgi:hypothetical protein